MAAVVGWLIGGVCLVVLVAFAASSVGMAALAARGQTEGWP